jgi:hypothetical protein
LYTWEFEKDGHALNVLRDRTSNAYRPISWLPTICLSAMPLRLALERKLVSMRSSFGAPEQKAWRCRASPAAVQRNLLVFCRRCGLRQHHVRRWPRPHRPCRLRR